MVRNIINVVVLGGLVVFAFFWFSKDFENPAGGGTDTLQAIPSSAAFIFECSDLADVWRDLSGESTVWNELLATEYFFRLNTIGENLDSLIRNDSKLERLISSKPIAISAHLTGGEEYGFLFALRLDVNASAEDVSRALSSTLKTREDQSRTYDGEKIFSFNSPLFDRRLFYYIKQDMLVFSLSEVLIEESIRTLLKGGSVMDKDEFLIVRNTIDRAARGHFYIHFQPIKTIVSSYVKAEGKKLGLFKNSFADWSALDLIIENNALSMNGFVMASDSSKAWLDVFAEIGTPRVELLDYLPSNTAYFAFLGFGDFGEYLAQQTIKLEKNGELFRFKKRAAEWDEICDCQTEQLGLSWISSQAISFITEPSSKDYSQNVFAAFMTEDAEDAEELLREFGAYFSEEEYGEKGDQIFRLPVGHFYRDLLGSTFSELENPYVARVEDAIVMANSENALRNYLNSISSGRSFTSSLAYDGLENQLFNEANLIVYSSLAKSPFILQDVLKDEHARSIENQIEVLRQFESIVYQISHSSGELYYNNLFLRQGSNYAQETGTIWELKLKASAIGKVHLLQNHYTGVLETLVQDEHNRIYLISNNGKIIWDRLLDGPLIGDVRQIDAYKNGKLQMLLSTDNSIYLIDRNGNDVESYPINLPFKATAGVSVADYDRSRDYRIFVPIQGSDVLCFDVLGKAVKGWEYNGGEGEVVEPMQHIRIKRKDYLFSITDDGRVLLLNRKGDIRHQVQTKLDSFQKGTMQLELGDKISSSSLYYADKQGAAHRLKFDDRQERFQPKPEPARDHFFAHLNDEESLDFCFLYDREFSAYSFAGDLLFEIDAPSSEFSSIAFHKSGKSRFISLTSPDKEEVSLYTSLGELVTGFPVFGNSEPSIGDINLDGYLELVVTGKDGRVYAYSIEEE